VAWEATAKRCFPPMIRYNLYPYSIFPSGIAGSARPGERPALADQSACTSQSTEARIIAPSLSGLGRMRRGWYTRSPRRIARPLMAQTPLLRARETCQSWSPYEQWVESRQAMVTVVEVGCSITLNETERRIALPACARGADAAAVTAAVA
jgi:hypothetical protein